MSESQTQKFATKGEFAILCFGGFLLSISYGITFLIPMLVEQRGGDEAFAGLIISTATVSTVIFVILSGHIADAIGVVRALVLSALFLAVSALGFALIPSAGSSLMGMGFVLGIGWGTFYTLGPILVSAIVDSQQRTQLFAILSGSMMAGIGTGPLIGHVALAWSLPIEVAFLFAFFCSLVGSFMYFELHRRFATSGTVGVQTSKLSLRTASNVMRSNSIYSIIMVGLGGALFGGLSSFQTSYAQHYGFNYSLFFIGFMVAVILCRLLLAGYVSRKDPFSALLVLTSLTLISVVLFLTVTTSSVIYLGTAALLGIGYGLTYSVINGLAANEAPTHAVPQSLLMFSLAYLIGAFGFPLIAGHLIVSKGIDAMLVAVLCLAVLSWTIVLFRILHRIYKRRKTLLEST